MTERHRRTVAHPSITEILPGPRSLVRRHHAPRRHPLSAPAHPSPLTKQIGAPPHAGSAIARLPDDALNPWQCRSAEARSAPAEHPAHACGADLTRESAPSMELESATMAALVHVQRHLGGLLAAGGPEGTTSAGASVPVAHHFADLRATVAMLFRTWPEARPYAGTSCLAAVLDAEHASRTAQVQPAQHRREEEDLQALHRAADRLPGNGRGSVDRDAVAQSCGSLPRVDGPARSQTSRCRPCAQGLLVPRFWIVRVFVDPRAPGPIRGPWPCARWRR